MKWINLFAGSWADTNPYAFGFGLYIGNLLFGGVVS